MCTAYRGSLSCLLLYGSKNGKSKESEGAKRLPPSETASYKNRSHLTHALSVRVKNLYFCNVYLCRNKYVEYTATFIPWAKLQSPSWANNISEIQQQILKRQYKSQTTETKRRKGSFVTTWLMLLHKLVQTEFKVVPVRIQFMSPICERRGFVAYSQHLPVVLRDESKQTSGEWNGVFLVITAALSPNGPSLFLFLKTPLYRIKISVSMFVLHSCGPLTQLDRYGMRGLNTIKVLLDLLPLNL